MTTLTSVILVILASLYILVTLFLAVEVWTLQHPDGLNRNTVVLLLAIPLFWPVLLIVGIFRK